MGQNPYNNIRYRKYSARNDNRESDFNELEAMELYCGECCEAVPVLKHLLIVLPEGEKYEYRCRYCGGKVGDKIDKSAGFNGFV